MTEKIKVVMNAVDSTPTNPSCRCWYDNESDGGQGQRTATLKKTMLCHCDSVGLLTARSDAEVYGEKSSTRTQTSEQVHIIVCDCTLKSSVWRSSIEVVRRPPSDIPSGKVMSS